MPPGFHRLIAAQFVSALADNALLLVTIALLQRKGLPGWWAPLLKFSFTLSYVLLAPWVGPLADALPKARLMAAMNGVKVLGVLGLIAGVHPLLAFAVVGLGAAAYAPAKYGLITELVGPQRLVAANGWLEVTVVGAALLGAVLGGVLVSPLWLGAAPVQALDGWLQGVASWADPVALRASLSASLVALLLVYALASLLNIGVPDSGARYPASRLDPIWLCRDFWQANRTLWRDLDGGLSLAVTTLFWGVGATLQFAVLRWAADVLALPLDRAAYLQAAVAVGVIVGASAAGRWVPLHQAKRMLWAGVALGLLMALMAGCRSVALAVPLLALAGAVGGLMVVPLNALLQHRGHALFSAGRSVAVQGFNENASVLGLLAIYAALLALEVPITALLAAYGVAIAAAMGALIARERGRARRRAGERAALPAST
ncbi:MAG: lysophospholipid transporter LplT [Leptothrix sp. (in: b-proteobacteria)]